MKNNSKKVFYRLSKLLLSLAIGFSLLSSCKDEYIYDDTEPDWLGASIYNYLENDSNFSISAKLIVDLKYDLVLSLTGSKTLFVAKDSAYREFFKSNVWGVSSYDQLTMSQKRMLFKFSMIDNPYSIQKLSNFNSGGVLYEGIAMRQVTSLDAIDSIPFVKGDDLPNSPLFDAKRESGMYLLRDNTDMPTVFFSDAFLNKYFITNEDLSIILGLNNRSAKDFHLFNNKVIQSNIKCKNGYIHVVQSVMIPPTNMAQFIQENNSGASNVTTKIFSKMLDRFCAPYYDSENTGLYRQKNPTNFIDSIFMKKYFSPLGGQIYMPNGEPAVNLLAYDPGWNSYKSSALEGDMAAMFVPSDDAMNKYFNSPVGSILKNRFGSWDKVPDNIALLFVKRHMRTSLIESVPSKFAKMIDAENYRLPVEKSHIEKTYTAVNGEVYITNEVYPPVDYISVYSPVLLSDDSQIMNWAINVSEASVDGTKFAFYKLYLNSLVSKYSLFIPSDSYFDDYIDPVAYGQDVPAVLKFKFKPLKSTVIAYVYKYDKVAGQISDEMPIDSIENQSFLKNRLWALLDSHIVVGDVETGKNYYVTKANDIIKVSGTGAGLKVQGGDDLRNNTKCEVTKTFEQYNGKTYFLNKPIQPALKSVYKLLSETAEFSKFFELLSGVPDTCINQIFTKQGIDYRVKFFNAFRYTVYVPTNQAIQDAIDAHKINSWETIYNIANPVQKSTEINRMIRFLKYHFQDNVVFSDQIVNQQFQSATVKNDNVVSRFGTAKTKFYKIGVSGNGTTLTLTMDNVKTDAVKIAKVLTANGLYNLIVKDYSFAKPLTTYKNVDGTGPTTGTLFNTSLVSTSSSAVIHQIDNVLSFE